LLDSLLLEKAILEWAGRDLDPVVVRMAGTDENQSDPVDLGHVPETDQEVDDTVVIEIDTAGVGILPAQILAALQDVEEKRWIDWQTEKEKK